MLSTGRPAGSGQWVTTMPSFTFETRIELPNTGEELQTRIKSLIAIKDELDREIAILLGRRIDFEPGRPYHCIRCDHKWVSRLPHRPKRCPQCRIKKFDVPPTYTYADRVRQTSYETREHEVPQAPLPHSVISRPQVSVENDSIQNMALTPPPVPGTMNPQPLSLRERLALMSKGGDAQSSAHNAALPIQQVHSTSAKEQELEGAAADGAHLIMNESASEDQLVEAINGDDVA